MVEKIISRAGFGIFMSKRLLQCTKMWIVNCIAFFIVKSEKTNKQCNAMMVQFW